MKETGRSLSYQGPEPITGNGSAPIGTRERLGVQMERANVIEMKRADGARPARLINDSIDAIMTIRRELGVCSMAAYGSVSALDIDENNAHMMEGLGEMLEKIVDELALIECNLGMAVDSFR